MYRYAVIKDSKVINVVIWDGVSNWSPEKGCIVVKNELCNIGDSYSPKNGFKPAPYAKPLGE